MLNNRIDRPRTQQLLWTALGVEARTDHFDERREAANYTISRVAMMRSLQAISIMDVNEDADGTLTLFFADAENSTSAIMSVIRSAYSTLKDGIMSERIPLSEALLRISDAVIACGVPTLARAILARIDVRGMVMQYVTAGLGFYKWNASGKGGVDLILHEPVPPCLGIVSLWASDHAAVGGATVLRPRVLPLRSGDLLFFLPDSLIFLNRAFYLPGRRPLGPLFWSNTCQIVASCNAILQHCDHFDAWPNDRYHPCPHLRFPKVGLPERDLFHYLFAIETLNGLFREDELVESIAREYHSRGEGNANRKAIVNMLAPYARIVARKEEVDYLIACSEIEGHIRTLRRLDKDHVEIKLKGISCNRVASALPYDTMAMSVLVK